MHSCVNRQVYTHNNTNMNIDVDIHIDTYVGIDIALDIDIVIDSNMETAVDLDTEMDVAGDADTDSVLSYVACMLVSVYACSVTAFARGGMAVFLLDHSCSSLTWLQV